MKINIHKISLVTVLSIILFSFTSSCKRNIQDSVKSGEISDKEKLPMSFQLKGLNTVDDNTVSKVRVVIFDEDGKIVGNDIRNHQTEGSGILVSVEIVRGRNDVFVICNETPELTVKLSAVALKSDIEKIKFNSIGVVSPLPMYGKVENAMVTANADGTNVVVTVGGTSSDKLQVNVERLLAKLSFTAIKNVADINDDFVVEGLRIRLCRMPLYNTIAKDVPYAETKWESGSVLAVGRGRLDNNGKYDVIGDEYIIPPGVDNITFPDVYIPENILSSKEDMTKATYLIVDATCKMKNGSTQTLHSVYNVILAHKPQYDYSLFRNNHYKVYATITSMGAMGIYAEIQAMEFLNVPINWKPIDGLTIVSDKLDDYGNDINIWSDYTTYFGLLKAYHSDRGYNDVLFKYGSLIAIHNEAATTLEKNFETPADATHLNDILWYPSIYGNPSGVITSWASIPYISGANIPLDNNRVAEGVGDPCKLVGLSANQIDGGIVDNKQWRMATSDDYNIFMSASDKEANDLGYKAFNQHLALNVKYRNNSGVLSASANGTGKYWTSTSANAFSFESANVGSEQISGFDRTSGLAVRCVRTSIPDIILSVNNSPSISYRGDLTGNISISMGSNTSYWIATLIEDPADPEIGTSREFEDFSFAPGGTNVKSFKGSYNTPIPVYVKRKESRSSRTYRVRITAIGFKGDVKTVHATVSQGGYSIAAIPSLDPLIDENNFIPKSGGTYNVTINLTPTDVPIPVGKLIVIARYHGVEIARADIEVPTEERKYEHKGVTLVIPENTYPNERGVYIVVLYVTPTSSVDWGWVYRMQKNK